MYPLKSRHLSPSFFPTLPFSRSPSPPCSVPPLCTCPSSYLRSMRNIGSLSPWKKQWGRGNRGYVRRSGRMEGMIQSDVMQLQLSFCHFLLFSAISVVRLCLPHLCFRHSFFFWLYSFSAILCLLVFAIPGSLCHDFSRGFLQLPHPAQYPGRQFHV